MGLFGQLKFALLCMDFFAWPVIALGFPMFVSIRAIETGSLDHMKKLVTYWTLFSLIYLFEFAFVEIIRWIPLWSSIKLTVMFWLVFPRFRGACYDYKNFVRPCLVLNPREAISRFEEKSRAKSKESLFIDVADEYIKDHGFGALEKLIATKRKHEEPYNSQRDITLNESGHEALKQLKEPVAVADLKDDNMLEIPETRAEAQVKPATEVSPTTTYAAAVTKGILARPPASIIPEKPLTAAVAPPTKSSLPRHKWKCILCKVETTCESNLNDHLRGSRHKAMCESLKLSKLNNTKQGTDGSKQNKTCELPGYKNEGPTRHWCFACDVELVGGASLMSHLNGKRHASNVTGNGSS